MKQDRFLWGATKRCGGISARNGLIFFLVARRFSRLPATVAMAQNLTVTTQDPKVHFDGDWTVQLSGYYEFTGQIGASVSLTFPGRFTVSNSPVLLFNNVMQELRFIGTRQKIRVVESRMSPSITIREPSLTSLMARIQPPILYLRYFLRNPGCRLARTIL